jgi:hypothetical protein
MNLLGFGESADAEAFSDLRGVPGGTTFAQGVEMLQAEQARLGENHKMGAAAEGPRSH